jgi:fucokinase
MPSRARRGTPSCGTPKSASKPTPWDYLILTASNDRQAEAYRAELARRERLGRIPQARRVLVVADPGGVRVGSGGSTIACLMRVLEIELNDPAGDAGRLPDPRTTRETPGARSAGGTSSRELRGVQAQVSRAWRETLDRLRILIIHAGGDSKRLPAYGPAGKIFVPVPAAREKEARGRRRLPVTIFDRLAPIYLGLPAPADGRGQTVISTGDVLLFFNPARAAFTRGGITALGCPVSPEIAMNHGVFIPDGGGVIRRYLQKPTPAAQKAAGAIVADGRARGRSILDMGVMSIDADAAVRLLEMSGVGPVRPAGAAGGSPRLAWSGPIGRAIETWGLDIFREIACAFGADTAFEDYVAAARTAGSPWDETRLGRAFRRLRGIGFTLSLVPRCRFLHFGTSRELIGSGNALRRRDKTARAGDSVVALDNVIERGGRIAGRDAWVEGCRIGAKLTVAGRNVVVGLDIAAPVAFPPNGALDSLRGTDRRGGRVWFVRPYGVDDVFHRPAERGGRLAGLALGDWLDALGANPEDVWDASVPPEDRQVWNGRFFPAAKRPDGWRAWMWMLAPRAATEARKRAWREADRYSFAEMAALADQTAFHARRRRSLRGA